MSLSPQDIAALSRLLDEALDLDASQREAWLHNMPAAGQHLVPQLREMLAARDSTGASGFLSALPALDPAPDTDASTAHAGESVGPYRLIREIGRGGMGTVWLAERADGAFKRQLALKLPRLTWGAGLAKRMARERDIGAMLEHPNIARLYDAGVDERGRPFIALEYIDGVAIDAWCQQHKLPLHDKLRLVVQVAKAVAYAHGRLVVHRDLKPSNVLVSADGQVHLLDFGIAKLLDDAQQEHAATQEQVRVLTPHYASPEQLKGETLTVQSDVYSLGVLAYELLTGQLPYDAKRKTSAAIEEAILQGEVIAPSQRVEDRSMARELKGDIDAIVGKAMKVEQGQHYPTTDALAADIERHLAGETVTARPDSRGYRLRKALKRHWIGVSASAAVLVSVLTGAGIAVVQAQRAAKAAEREQVVKAFVAEVFRINFGGTNRDARRARVPADMLLENSAKLIQTRFVGKPDLQAELFGVVGGIFSDMGAYRLATLYATRQVESLDTLQAPTFERARAILNLAEAMIDEGRPAEAEASVRLAQTLAVGHPREGIRASVLRARIEVATGRFEEAETTLGESETLLTRMADAPGREQAWVVALRAESLVRNNHLEEAFPLYLRAVEVAVGTEGPTSLTAAAIRLSGARWYRQTADLDRTRQLFEPAIATLRMLDGPHKVRAASQTVRHWRVMASSTRFGDALKAIEGSATELREGGDAVPSILIAEADMALGHIRSAWGDVQGASEFILHNHEALWAWLADPHERFMLATTVGQHAQDRGDHVKADVWLNERAKARKEAGRGNHPYAANDYRFLAENAMMAGRLEDAERILRSAPTFEPIRVPTFNPQRYKNLINEMLGRVLLAKGDLLAAKAALPQRGVERQDGTLWGIITDPRGVKGEALCLNGSPEQGLKLLEAMLAGLHQDHFEHAPQVARLKGALGLCALRAGDRAKATDAARQARESFTVQPGVSDFYKAPLLELEAKLAKR